MYSHDFTPGSQSYMYITHFIVMENSVLVPKLRIFTNQELRQAKAYRDRIICGYSSSSLLSAGHQVVE